jgi:RimJ/RimL family protein N-acetyltransferase
MRHSLITQGFGIRLRPVQTEDAPFIVWLRNLEHVKGRLGDSAEDVKNQVNWLNDYFERQGDYYFIVETLHGVPLGTHSIYNFSGSRAEVGRFAIRPGVPAAIHSSFLLADLFYGQMSLTELQATSVASSLQVHSFICRLGFRKVRVEREGRVIGGRSIDMVHFVQTAKDWSRARERLSRAMNRSKSAIQRLESDSPQSDAELLPIGL